VPFLVAEKKSGCAISVSRKCGGRAPDKFELTAPIEHAGAEKEVNVEYTRNRAQPKGQLTGLEATPLRSPRTPFGQTFIYLDSS
jgi:hypothetical protein